MMPRPGAAELATAVVVPTAVARSQFEDLGAAVLLQCAAQAIEAATGIGATGIEATGSVRQPSARRLLAPQRTGVAATTPTAIGFALTNSSACARTRTACGKRGADVRPHFEPAGIGTRRVK